MRASASAAIGAGLAAWISKNFRLRRPAEREHDEADLRQRLVGAIAVDLEDAGESGVSGGVNPALFGGGARAG